MKQVAGLVVFLSTLILAAPAESQTRLGQPEESEAAAVDGALAIPEFKTITISAHDDLEATKVNTATIGVTCSLPYPYGVNLALESRRTYTFEIPAGVPCSAKASNGRFGPQLDGGFVLDYSSTWPDPDLGDYGDHWHIWIGDDAAHPVHWVLVNKTEGSITERPAAISCSPAPGEWQGTLQYDRISRFVNYNVRNVRFATEPVDVGPCQWSFEAIPEFDGVRAEVFGPTVLAEREGRTHDGDPSTLTIVNDYLLHPNTSAQAFLNAMHRKANGRPGLPGEAAWWTPKIDADPGYRGLLVDAIIRSEEYRSKTEPIARLYQAYFDRLPDAEGLAYWTDVASRGSGLLEISTFFSQSDEFVQRYGSADNGQFVRLAYNNVLSRQPDTSGYQYWLDALTTQVLDGPGVIYYFSNSDEFRVAMRDRLAVTGTYTLLLNRPPTEAEIVSGIDSLVTTDSLALLANTLIDSPAYQAAFAHYQ